MKILPGINASLKNQVSHGTLNRIFDHEESAKERAVARANEIASNRLVEAGIPAERRGEAFDHGLKTQDEMAEVVKATVKGRRKPAHRKTPARKAGPTKLSTDTVH